MAEGQAPAASQNMHIFICSHAVQDAAKTIQAAAENLGLRLKLLDKRAEKALVQAQQKDLQGQLADQTDPAAALSLVVPLLVMKVWVVMSHRLLHCPVHLAQHILE